MAFERLGLAPFPGPQKNVDCDNGGNDCEGGDHIAGSARTIDQRHRGVVVLGDRCRVSLQPDQKSRMLPSNSPPGQTRPPGTHS